VDDELVACVDVAVEPDLLPPPVETLLETIGVVPAILEGGAVCVTCIWFALVA
jgi:hypothetical protein